MYRRKKDSKKAIQNLLNFYAQIGNSDRTERFVQSEQEHKKVYQDIVTQGDKAPEKKVR